MNFHHLRYFLTITRRGGFTQAARELNVTQPTVSSGIAELERNLGVKLFNRDSRHVNLTPQGRTLVSYAEQIEDLLEEAGQRLSGDVMPDGFRFGAIDAAVIYLLPDILKRYLDSYPELDLSIQVEPSHYLVESLLTNRSEFALISLPLDNPKVQTISLCSDDMPLVVGAGHPPGRACRHYAGTNIAGNAHPLPPGLRVQAHRRRAICRGRGGATHRHGDAQSGGHAQARRGRCRRLVPAAHDGA